MTVTLQEFNHSRVKTDLPDIRPGHIVKVHQKIVEKKGSGKKQEVKERVQIFEGLVIGKKGGNGINATITVRKISDGIGVEKVFPLSAPTIEKIELIKIVKVRRAKLNYMRDRIGKATRPKGELVKPEENKRDKSDEKTGKIEAEDKNKESDNEKEKMEVEKDNKEEKKEAKEKLADEDKDKKE